MFNNKYTPKSNKSKINKSLLLMVLIEKSKKLKLKSKIKYQKYQKVNLVKLKKHWMMTKLIQGAKLMQAKKSYPKMQKTLKKYKKKCLKSSSKQKNQAKQSILKQKTIPVA